MSVVFHLVSQPIYTYLAFNTSAKDPRENRTCNYALERRAKDVPDRHDIYLDTGRKWVVSSLSNHLFSAKPYPAPLGRR
jgi:hypothetical protein